MSSLNLYCLTDSKCFSYQDKILESLKFLSTDYEKIGIGLNWILEERDFSNLNWIKYNYIHQTENSFSLGVDFATINQETLKVRLAKKETIDYVAFIIDESNWKQGTARTWGWNLGEFFNGYQVVLVMGRPNINDLYKIFNMEIAHGLNDVVKVEAGINLADYLKVSDFDEDIIHGRTPLYKAYDYNLLFNQTKDILNKSFERRNTRGVFKFQFLKNLEYKQKNNDIYNLQIALKCEALFPIETNETGYYGNTTAEAVLKFWKRYNITSWYENLYYKGQNVGSKTRNQLNKLYGG